MPRRASSWPTTSAAVGLAVALAAGPLLAQQMYMRVGADGSITVTDRPGGGQFRPYSPGDFERWALGQKATPHEGHRPTPTRRRAPKASAYDELIRRKAERYGVPFRLVRAVVAVESAFRPDARSHAGAQGLMQLMPQTAAELGVEDPFDPEQNVDGGTRYLAGLLRMFKREDLALAAYNAGPGRVRRAGGIPRITETRRYVKRVLRLSAAYDE